MRHRAQRAADPNGRPPPRHAATLIPIVDGPDGPQTVVFERTMLVADHKGEICFPGGSLEAEDAGPVEAALREASEELGIESDAVEILGMLDDVGTFDSNFAITPVVGRLRVLPSMRADGREVARVIVVSLDELCDKRSRRTMTVVIGGAEREVEAIPVDGGHIWGATLRTLDLLCAALKD